MTIVANSFGTNSMWGELYKNWLNVKFARKCAASVLFIMSLAKCVGCLSARLLTDIPVRNTRMDFLYDGAFKMFYPLYSSISKHFYSSKSNTDSNKRHFSVSIEGNIGSGKTNLLNYFSSFPEVEVLVEPVSKWQDIDGYNALKQFYQDPSRWALTFQTYVQLTMVEQHLHKQVKPIKLMERSIYSAKYCFVENLYKTGIMPELEYLVLSKWFDWLTANQNLQLDLIVYLQTTPETVYHRIKKRCRQEEIGIPLDYLTALHNLHEDWLIHQKRFPVNCPVLVLDGNGTKMDMIEQFEAHKQQIMCQRS